MACKEFEKAGKKPGLQIWRVEKMELKPVPEELYGIFYTGDGYIVMSTSPGFKHEIHSWAGKEASQDERGAAAIFMSQLDDYLGGLAVQNTEFQGEESKDFMTYFKTGIQYMKGGVASGFQHVVSNDDNVKRLLHVKGKRTVRASELDLDWKSFNSEDCFIIELGEDIYSWSGKDSNRWERLKTTFLANSIRDNEKCGRGEVHQINEGEEPGKVLQELGEKPDPLPPPESPECDIAVSKEARTQASLYMVSDFTGEMDMKLVADKNPFNQNDLDPEECYILDNGKNKQIFVWKGKKANAAERKIAYDIAHKFIEQHKYPSNTQVQIIPDGGETTLFKEFFFHWLDKDETEGCGEANAFGRIAKVEKIPFDASTLHDNKAMAAQHGMVDDGSGKVEIFRAEVDQEDPVPMDESCFGQFYGGDCYLIHYTYNCGCREKHIIYFWQGMSCSQDEAVLSALQTVRMDDSLGGKATQVRVTQGKEPPHLISLFKQSLIIHRGGTSREGGQTTAAPKRLFHIRQSSTKATRAVEVEPTASALNSNDVFVLKTRTYNFIWKGKGGTDEELEAAKYVAGVLGGDYSDINEEEEPESFWDALGGRGDYQTSPTLKNALKPPRLFGCSNKTGRLIAEEVPGELAQTDLAPDDVMILDTGDQIFLWIGNDAMEEEKQGAKDIAEEYLASDPSGRGKIPIAQIKQGEEPLTFTGWFQAWDDELWEKMMMGIL